MIARIFRPVGLLLLLILSAPSTALAADKVEKEVYIAGFVRDKDGNGIRDATVILTDRHRKLFTLRTHQKGWFESIDPLDNSYLGTELRITVIKSGYQLNDDTRFTVDANRNFLDIVLQPVEDVVASADYETYQSGVTYGRVVDRQGTPIQGAVITINATDSEIPLSSTVSRESGYFSIYYSKIDPQKEYEYSIEHYVHDSREGRIELNEKTDYLDLSLEQNTYRYSLGAAFHFQSTKKVNDTESGGALVINLSIYREPLVVVDRFIPRYRKYGIIGYDIGVGAVPFRQTSAGADTVEYVGLLALGATYATSSFILPLRFGLSYTDTDKVAGYFGINIPFYYF